MNSDIYNAFMKDVDALPTVTGSIVTNNGTISLNESLLGSGSLSFKMSASGGGFAVGGATISSCSFTLLDFDHKYDNYDFDRATVTFDLTINGKTFTYWKGYIDEAKQAYNTISISCFDKMGLLDEYTIEDLGITLPITRTALVKAICNKVGITCKSSIVNGSASIPAIDSDTTLRQALSYIGEAGGKFAYLDTANDVLMFKWFEFGSAVVPTDIFGRSLNRKIVTIDGIDVFTYDGKSDVKKGNTSGLLKNFKSNPCITSATIKTDATNIGDALIGHPIITGGFTILANAGLQVGDVLSIVSNGVSCLYPIASLTYKPTVTEALNCNELSSDTSDKRKTETQQTIDNSVSDTSTKLGRTISSVSPGGGGGTGEGGTGEGGIGGSVGGKNNHYGTIKQYGVNSAGEDALRFTIDKEGLHGNVTICPDAIADGNTLFEVQSKSGTTSNDTALIRAEAGSNGDVGIVEIGGDKIPLVRVTNDSMNGKTINIGYHKTPSDEHTQTNISGSVNMGCFQYLAETREATMHSTTFTDNPTIKITDDSLFHFLTVFQKIAGTDNIYNEIHICIIFDNENEPEVGRVVAYNTGEVELDS